MADGHQVDTAVVVDEVSLFLGGGEGVGNVVWRRWNWVFRHRGSGWAWGERGAAEWGPGS